MDVQKFIIKGTSKYVIFLLILIFLVNFAGIPNTFSYSDDIWAHTAVINEFSENPFSPHDPFYGSEYHGHLYRPYLFGLGLIKKIFDLDVFSVVFLASAINICLLFVGIYYFTREYFNDKVQPIYTIIIMLFFWGMSLTHSNEYSFKMLTIGTSYPSTFAFACSLIVFYLVLKYIKTNRTFYYVASLILGVIIFLSHPFTSSFLFLTVIIIALSEKANIRNKFLIFFFPFAVLFIASFWPYYSWYNMVLTPVSKTISTSFENTVPIFYSLDALLLQGLLLFVGTIILLNLFLKKKYKLIYCGGVLFILIYIIFGALTITYGGRYLYFYIFFLHLAIAREFRERNLFSLNKIKEINRSIINYRSNSYPQKDMWETILIGTFFLSSIIGIGWTCAPHFVDKQDNKLVIHDYVAYKYHIDYGEYKFLEKEVKHYDIILSDPQTSMVIPTYNGKAVYADARDSFRLFKEFLTKNKLENNTTNETFIDVVIFFQQNTNIETKREIIDKYNVSYILINHNLKLFDERTINEIESMGNKTYYSKYFTLVKVK